MENAIQPTLSADDMLRAQNWGTAESWDSSNEYEGPEGIFLLEYTGIATDSRTGQPAVSLRKNWDHDENDPDSLPYIPGKFRALYGFRIVDDPMNEADGFGGYDLATYFNVSLHANSGFRPLADQLTGGVDPATGEYVTGLPSNFQNSDAAYLGRRMWGNIEAPKSGRYPKITAIKRRVAGQIRISAEVPF